jgi:membrane associated rhomboid family serine protease
MRLCWPEHLDGRDHNAKLGAMFPVRDHNPSGRTPYVTYALVASNVLIFLGYWSLLSQPAALSRFYFDWAFIPARLTSGENLSGLVTSMFLHGGVMHLLGNMLFLYIFGDNLEDEMGHFGFAAFYLVSGVVATLAQYISEPNSPVAVIGASGAIAGVMGGYLLLYPKAKVDVLFIIVIFFRIIPIPAWIVLMVWFGMQVFSGVSASDGGVAYWAHIGGFIAGFILTVPLWLRNGGPRFWNQTSGHPPHPEAQYSLSSSGIPKIRRKNR